MCHPWIQVTLHWFVRGSVQNIFCESWTNLDQSWPSKIQNNPFSKNLSINVRNHIIQSTWSKFLTFNEFVWDSSPSLILKLFLLVKLSFGHIMTTCQMIITVWSFLKFGSNIKNSPRQIFFALWVSNQRCKKRQTRRARLCQFYHLENEHESCACFWP